LVSGIWAVVISFSTLFLRSDDQQKKGLFYRKVMKTASSTTSSVHLRVARNHLARRNTTDNNNSADGDMSRRMGRSQSVEFTPTFPQRVIVVDNIKRTHGTLCFRLFLSTSESKASGTYSCQYEALFSNVQT
jgi:hypothetical protein